LPGMDQSFWQAHGDEVSAVITMAIAVVIAIAVDRLVLSRARRVADRFAEGGVSRVTQTRLQVVRRLVFVVIIVIGAALALSQFGQIKRLATGILASSAVIGLVIGFAARQTIANMVAGVLLAISQPLRIGDRVTFEDETGRVDDVTLSYTYIDTGDGRLMVVPNEKIVSGTLFNHSTGDPASPIAASVWLPPSADVGAARRALEPIGADVVSVAEVTTEGLRLEIRTSADTTRTRAGGEEAALRERAQNALREAGVLQ
jgi:small-conductance mechanosensitive channel